MNRGVAAIGGASFLDDVGQEVPTALLPAFLTSTLAAPAAALGLIEGVADGVAGAARLAGGALADDPQRRRATAVGGYAGAAVLSALIGLATAAWQVGVLRSGAWLMRGLRTPARNALLADVASPVTYGRAYGFERAMDNLGAIIGPLLALALVTAVGVRTAIVVSVIPGLLAAAAMGAAAATVPLGARRGGPLRLRVRPVLRGDLGRLLAGISAFELGNVAATLLILRATELLTPDRGHDSAVKVALLLYAGYNVAATAISLPAGRYADRRGSRFTLAGGVAITLAAYLGFAFAGSVRLVLLLLFLAAGAGNALVETSEHAGVASLAPESLRGSAFGTLAAAQSFGRLAASSVAGLLWTLVSPRAAFLYLAAWTVVSLLVLRFARGTS
jgi:MFS family permease